MMADAIICFPCCFTVQPQPQKRRRRKIDASMIGLPTNFQHTSHVGSGDVGNRSFISPVTGEENCRKHLTSIQNQMSSKGGYDTNNAPESDFGILSPVDHQIPLKELQKENVENHT
ncbi:CDC42 small effector protein 2-like [Argonauta hians]